MHLITAIMSADDIDRMIDRALTDLHDWEDIR